MRDNINADYSITQRNSERNFVYSKNYIYIYISSCGKILDVGALSILTHSPWPLKHDSSEHAIAWSSISLALSCSLSACNNASSTATMAAETRGPLDKVPYARKTIFILSFPVTLTVDLLTSNLLPWLLKHAASCPYQILSLFIYIPHSEKKFKQ